MVMQGMRLITVTMAATLVLAGGAIAQEQEKPATIESRSSDSTSTTAPTQGVADKEVCATCHEEVATALATTAHGRTGVANWDGLSGCQSCHGPGQAHVDGGGDVAKIRNPKKIPAAEVSAICLKCHERGERSHWQGSQHDQRGLSCLTCHAIHPNAARPQGPHLLAKVTEFDTCGSCHLKRKAALYRSAHMPLREGSMQCTSCHNPHGSNGPALLKQNSINENCYACHAEKRSPALWEHPPVKESCANCHDPHGSLHPRLLVAKQPRLCQQCHDETRHPTQPYSDASTAPEFFPNSRMFDRGCMNCHSQIHGSNHPAGNRFLR